MLNEFVLKFEPGNVMLDPSDTNQSTQLDCQRFPQPQEPPYARHVAAALRANPPDPPSAYALIQEKGEMKKRRMTGKRKHEECPAASGTAAAAAPAAAAAAPADVAGQDKSIAYVSTAYKHGLQWLSFCPMAVVISLCMWPPFLMFTAKQNVQWAIAYHIASLWCVPQECVRGPVGDDPEADAEGNGQKQLDPSDFGVPAEAMPQSTKRGRLSYTIAGQDGVRVEVNLKARNFFVKHPLVQNKSIGWSAHGGPAAAWEEAKRRSGFKLQE